jgi:hypothetical protein
VVDLLQLSIFVVAVGRFLTVADFCSGSGGVTTVVSLGSDRFLEVVDFCF